MIGLSMVFLVGGALAMLLVVAGFWQSVRAALGATDLDSTDAPTRTAHREMLLDEKDNLLRTIRELEFERKADKTSEEDFKRLDRNTRLRAMEVMRLLDEDVGPFRLQARSLIEAHLAKQKLGSRRPPAKPTADKKLDATADAAPAATPASAPQACHDCGTNNDFDADWCKRCGARLSPQACAKCETINDADAAFCKRCAGPMVVKAGQPPPSRADGKDDRGGDDGAPEGEAGQDDGAADARAEGEAATGDDDDETAADGAAEDRVAADASAANDGTVGAREDGAR